ncbi:trypsin-like peptidase domain-containing protein [Rhodospirillales bacterium]|nr:trypsin-like peptidase domain-containing protein [Rhodospirillales bacterium]
MMLKSRWLWIVFVASAFLSSSVDGLAQTCDAPEPVCAAADNVVAISGFEPIGSAVAVGNGMLVTNRHMVADLESVTVVLPNGERAMATVTPTDYAGDLVLLKTDSLASAVPLLVSRPLIHGVLYVIGFDLGREAIRVYKPGRMIVDVAETPLARLHMDASALPGNSGGAVVNALGNLVGIVASGGEGRNEAIPATEIERVKDVSGPAFKDASMVIGRAYRACVDALNDVSSQRGPLSPQVATAMSDSCRASNNRQLMDLAGQAFGQRRDIDRSLALLEASYDQDPNAPNTVVSLAITYHLAQRWADEIAILRHGLEILPDDVQLLRLALQAGIWGGEQDLADFAMNRIMAVLPQMAPAARRFYDNPPPAPQVRPPG